MNINQYIAVGPLDGRDLIERDIQAAGGILTQGAKETYFENIEIPFSATAEIALKLTDLLIEEGISISLISQSHQ